MATLRNGSAISDTANAARDATPSPAKQSPPGHDVEQLELELLAGQVDLLVDQRDLEVARGVPGQLLHAEPNHPRQHGITPVRLPGLQIPHCGSHRNPNV